MLVGSGAPAARSSAPPRTTIATMMASSRKKPGLPHEGVPCSTSHRRSESQVRIDDEQPRRPAPVTAAALRPCRPSQAGERRTRGGRAVRARARHPRRRCPGGPRRGRDSRSCRPGQRWDEAWAPGPGRARQQVPEQRAGGGHRSRAPESAPARAQPRASARRRARPRRRARRRAAVTGSVVVGSLGGHLGGRLRSRLRGGVLLLAAPPAQPERGRLQGRGVRGAVVVCHGGSLSREGRPGDGVRQPGPLSWARLLMPGTSAVGLTGFEPAASSSRTRRATKLRHSPMRGSAKADPTSTGAYRSPRDVPQSGPATGPDDRSRRPGVRARAAGA